MKRDGIKEILESGQFPGVTFSEKVRSAVFTDAAGRKTRVIYGGAVDTREVEKDMVDLATRDGRDVHGRSKLDIVHERGQGVGGKHTHSATSLSKKRMK